jgi:hypothetical protein
MYDTIKIYGDSHSNPVDCRCDEGQMHWHIVSKMIPHLTLKTQYRAGKSIPEICIESSIDMLNYRGRCLFLLALGPLHRIPMYQDGRYDKETIRPIDASSGNPTDQSACDQFFDITTPKDTPKKFMGLYHPTLNASRTLQCLSGVLSIADKTKHDVVIYNMSKPWKDCGFDKSHPLVSTLWKEVFSYKYMSDMDHSAQAICTEKNIRAWDHEIYGVHGHMDHEGQAAWAEALAEILRHKGII